MAFPNTIDFKGFIGYNELHAPVAQGIEQRTSNPLVGGSNPPRRTKAGNRRLRGWFQLPRLPVSLK